MLRKPDPAVITTPQRNGQPVSTATWYLRRRPVLVNMDEDRKRLKHMRSDPRIARQSWKFCVANGLSRAITDRTKSAGVTPPLRVVTLRR